MKNLTLSSIAVSLLLISGCAGITDANLSDVEKNTASDISITNPADLRTHDLDAQDGSEIFGHDDEDVIVVKPEKEKDRD